MKEYKKETQTLLKRYFKGDPEVGYETLRARLIVLRSKRQKIDFNELWNGVAEDK